MTADKENFLLTPNMDINNYVRPLSAYDNLHSTLTHLPAATATTTTMQQQKSSLNHSNGNEKEFPFNNISFRFDDLPLQNQPTSHFNQIKSNSTISNSNNCNGNHNKSTSQGYTTIANYNGINITTSNKTAAPVVTIDSASNMLVGATKQQYENVSETVRLRNLNSNKPVISEAKSSFFGLNTSSPLNNSKQTMALRHNNQTSSGKCPYEDCSPLLNNVSGVGTRNHYQNIPSNSACFDSGNQMFNNVDGAVENNKNVSNSTSTKSETSSDCVDSSQNNNSSKYFADSSHRMSQSPSQVCLFNVFIFFNVSCVTFFIHKTDIRLSEN